MKALSLTSHTQHFAVLLIAVLFIGCTVGKTSSLMKDLDNANATRLAAKYGDATRLSTAIAVAEDDPSRGQRNILLNDLILLVDLNYNHWEKLLYDKKAGFDLSSDAVLLGLGGATALTGTTEVANILGQITTGITGFKTSVDTGLLQKKAVPALVAKMRATRASQLLKLQAAMINKISTRPNRTPNLLRKLRTLLEAKNMTAKVFKLELAQIPATDSTGKVIEDPIGTRINKIYADASMAGFSLVAAYETTLVTAADPSPVVRLI